MIRLAMLLAPPQPAARAEGLARGSTLIGAGQLGAGNDIRLGGLQHRGDINRGDETDAALLQRENSKAIVVRARSRRRAGAAVAEFAEIVLRLTECGGLAGMVAARQTAIAGGDIVGRPMAEHATRRVGVLDQNDEARGIRRRATPLERR